MYVYMYLDFYTMHCRNPLTSSKLVHCQSVLRTNSLEEFGFRSYILIPLLFFRWLAAICLNVRLSAAPFGGNDGAKLYEI